MNVGLGLYNSGKYDGFIEGKAEGKLEGKAEGKLERNLEIIRLMMKKSNSSLKEIMELLGINLEQYDYYNQLLQKEENSEDLKD